MKSSVTSIGLALSMATADYTVAQDMRYSPNTNSIVYNKNIQDYTVNTTNIINQIAVGGIENFNKSIELTQRYYNDIVQNNVNYAQKIERSYNRQ